MTKSVNGNNMAKDNKIYKRRAIKKNNPLYFFNTILVIIDKTKKSGTENKNE
jgi:hypothetical protein